MERLVARVSAAWPHVFADRDARLPDRHYRRWKTARVSLGRPRKRGAVPGALSDFTPFGYLRNPGHRARSWSDTSGGNLRTTLDLVGVEWVYPVGRDAASRVGLVLETVVDGRPCRGVDDDVIPTEVIDPFGESPRLDDAG